MINSFCIVCDKSHTRDVNHWFCVVIVADLKNKQGGKQSLSIKPWNEYDAHTAERQATTDPAQTITTVVSVCGQSHALTVVERFLNTGKLTR